jgi:hypothetical protein
MAQEMESDERGARVADVNPTTLEMLVTDCPCESSPGVGLETPAMSLNKA